MSERRGNDGEGDDGLDDNRKLFTLVFAAAFAAAAAAALALAAIWFSVGLSGFLFMVSVRARTETDEMTKAATVLLPLAPLDFRN